MDFPRTEQMISDLRAEKVETWFDLGLLIDRLREDRPGQSPINDNFGDYKQRLARGTAFLTFAYGVDGVSMEVAKYARSLSTVLPGAKIHFIAGKFADLTENILDPKMPWHSVEGIDGFDELPLYHVFFGEKLKRGSQLYNELIRDLWQAVLKLCEQLGRIIEANDIQLLFLINVNSNPGNPALALANVLISHFLDLPVINNCHDFYWESGHSKIQRKVGDLPHGSRDHFFTNAHVGEVFSLIEMIYPWTARNWLTVCINAEQVDASIERFGANPANVCEICTGIDAELYAPVGRGRSKDAWHQVNAILKNGSKHLQAQPVERVIRKSLLTPERRRPILIAATKQSQVKLAVNNMVLLQPTRILERKRIDFNFTLIASLLENQQFASAFRSDKTQKLTLMISGPVAIGQEKSLNNLIKNFERFLQKIDESIRSRIYLALLFSEFDNPTFRSNHEQPIGMPDLYNMASLVVLPSETEGRGLPIIESAACGVPLFTRRYEPEEVFSTVIGEKLADQDRLKVWTFRKWKIKKKILAQVRDYLLAPEHFRDHNRHNRRVVKRRFSLPELARDLDRCLLRIHCQMGNLKSAMTMANDAFDQFDTKVSNPGADFARLVSTQHREYLPGFGRMGFMLMLKSLIDPSYFRVEEQLNRGMAYKFARRLLEHRKQLSPIEFDDELEYYNRVACLFRIRCGEMSIRIDHSMAYRHRNRKRYRYRELTAQELTAVMMLVDQEMFGSIETSAVSEEITHQLHSWKKMVARCCVAPLEIDERMQMLARLSENRPFALFLGDRSEYQLEVFVLQTARIRLGLGIHDDLSDIPEERLNTLAPITLIEREHALPEGINAEALSQHLEHGSNRELRRLHQLGICRVVASGQLSLGIDFRQLGENALQALVEIRDQGGFIITLCEQAAMTTDGVELERFHLGRTSDELSANILGIPIGSGFVQWAPPGLRCTLTYPTPIQTAKTLSATLNSSPFRRLCKQLSSTEVFNQLLTDANQKGSPVNAIISQLTRSNESRPSRVNFEALNGLYQDGCPWSGVIATVNAETPLRYTILSASEGNQTVLEFVDTFKASRRHRPRIAWNGGYILNAELVGKLGLPESYIGSPLGLVVSEGELLSPPLFDKPSFVVNKDGSLEIRRISNAAGFTASLDQHIIKFEATSRNLSSPDSNPCFYDLLYSNESLPGDGRTIVRLVGSKIMEIRETARAEDAPVLPVGLVLSFAKDTLPESWKPGKHLKLEFPALSGVQSAIEAGPMLLEEGQVQIDMEGEGWTTTNSIRTQAARLDFLDMRGPKIAIGLDQKGTLAVLVVNGRIRESVGATHPEMAEILRQRGMHSAMGFDPGGSATLVVKGKTLNISPYNKDYDRNVYALPPEPRAVASAVIGY